MARTQKSTFYFFRNFGWKLLILSLFISGGAAYLLRESFYPYEFDIVETISGELDHEITYHDFDHDGFSEMMEIRNFATNRYNILVTNWNGGTIDQANYWEPIARHGLMFEDITGDGFDEILGFSQENDTLYFYLHDLITKTALIKRLVIDCVKEPLSSDRAAGFFPVCIADSNIYNSNVFIFVARTHNALSPRTVYALDLDNRKIIAEFKTKSNLIHAFPYDLNSDGSDEVIAYGYASGNVHYPAEYKDDKCWLFVLNQKLEPVFPPLSFSQYPSYLYCLPIEIYSERYILVLPEYTGDKNLDNTIYLINSLGKVHLKALNPFEHPVLTYIGYNPIVNRIKNPSVIYGWKYNNQVLKIDHNLEILKNISIPYEEPRPKVIKDIDADGEEEIFYISKNHLLVFDGELNLLAKFPNPKNLAKIGFKENGPKKPLEISFQLPDQYYLLRLVKNQLSSFLPLIFIGFTGVIFLFLNGSYKLSNRIVTRSRMFKYLRLDSSDGVLIVDHNCFIVFFNNSFTRILNLHPQPKKGDEAVSILNHYPQIAEFIKNSRESGETVNQKIVIGDEESRFESEVLVQPYKYPFKREFNYLVILKYAYTSLHSDKIHTWSRAVQKIAHDIKTPLSTVSLNLKVLQTRLEKIRLSETEHNELSDDILMMRTELDNIQLMTKNFLKFSNLDKPHSQAFNISKIIEDARNKFQPYINAELDIQVSIDNDVKPVWADPQQIEMVFTILLENALAAMQGKGLININISTVQYLENIFSDSLEIEVADTGPGINEEDRARIFEPYFSTKSEGTGMGLAIAKKIIEDNGGHIEVHSKPNFGAVFRFSLPVIKEEEKNE